MQFDKIKTLRAIESGDHKYWLLQGSCKKLHELKEIILSKTFKWIDKFNSKEECKIFCDIHLPDVPLQLVTFEQWFRCYYLGC